MYNAKHKTQQKYLKGVKRQTHQKNIIFDSFMPFEAEQMFKEVESRKKSLVLSFVATRAFHPCPNLVSNVCFNLLSDKQCHLIVLNATQKNSQKGIGLFLWSFNNMTS